MLDTHLRAVCRPVANEKNVLRWKNYRVTVLNDRLFRIEQSGKGEFCDGATQAIWFRDTPAVSFTVREEEHALTVDTGAAALILKEPFAKSRILLNGKEVKISNAGNLRGTYRTLDGCDGPVYTYGERDEKIRLGVGVCSKTGVAVLDDGETLLLNGEGQIVPREPAFDRYVFAYGNDYRSAVKALYTIEGFPPMIPRYALGNWWSRYHAYTEREYLQVLNGFEEHDVPLSVATIDMDWHYSDYVDEEKQITASGKNTAFYGGNNGWTGYSWNKNLFPDYKAFLKKIEDKNLKITLNLHPADGVRWWEDRYNEFAAALGKDALTQAQIPFDFTSDDYINNYFKILHRPYEKDGVAFWWIDWQQGKTTKLQRLDPLWLLNHYHYLDNSASHDVGLILSRYCGAGAHRYPLGFTGDTSITWKTLRYLPYFTATASNVGYSWWSHDIGGHHHGAQDEELYVRFLQFGVFNPINRLHSTCNPVMTKEPWFYPNGSGLIAQEFLRLRHKLVPYLYTAVYRTHTEGLALVEPMYYAYPEAQEAYRVPNQYLFGGQMLVAPITAKGGKDGYASVKVWLPEGVWTDFFTGERYEGGKTAVMRRTLESIPVLVKEGGIVPLDDRLTGNGCPIPEVMRVKIYRGSGAYTLVEEQNGKRAFTRFESKGEAGVQTIAFTVQDEDGVIPENRKWIFEFSDIEEGAAEITVNGTPQQPCERISCHPVYEVCGIRGGDECRITLNYCALSRLDEWKKNAVRVFKCTNGDTDQKRSAYFQLKDCETEAAFIRTVEESGLPDIVKKKLLEIAL